MQHWGKLDHRRESPSGPCLVKRSQHAAVCLGYGGGHLVLGGLSYLRNVLSDIWVLDIQSKKWKEVCERLGMGWLCPIFCDDFAWEAIVLHSERIMRAHAIF